MTVLPIRRLGDPVLRELAQAVESFDHVLKRLYEDMLETMYDAPGVGLAAPQVGLSLRFFVFDANDGSGPHAVANPILSGLDGSQVEDEGCLSIPGLWYASPRALRARVDGLDLDGNPVLFEGEGLVARIFQHETDHLDGTLFIDRLPERDRREAMASLRDQDLNPRPGRSARPRPE
ncbi:MAG TPA: peptide deformylase [Actinomycetota bacterium]|nr:peptide deformylase [Actinomycetota bacterium]